MEIWLWIKDNPWWTALCVWFALSTAVVIVSWVTDPGEDDDGRPSSTIGGYTFFFFAWPLFFAMLMWIWITTPKPPHQVLPSKQ